jgi:predicted protein tyrosine phosphatase
MVYNSRRLANIVLDIPKRMRYMDKKYISDNKRVILITGDQSKWYEQAIFIVRKNNCASFAAADLIAEAESIVSNYVGAAGAAPSPAAAEKIPPPARAKKRRRTALDTLINTLLVFAAAGMLVLLAHTIFG